MLHNHAICAKIGTVVLACPKTGPESTRTADSLGLPHAHTQTPATAGTVRGRGRPHMERSNVKKSNRHQHRTPLHILADKQNSFANRREHLNGLGPCIYATLTSRGGHIKIGFSNSVGNRLGQLGSFDNILAIRFGATLAEEQALHRSLTGEAVKGREYYAPTPPVLAVINDMRAELGMPALTETDFGREAA